MEFEIFEPGSDREVQGGTISRARAICPCCQAVLPPERVRAQLATQRGGADVVFDDKGNRIGGARLLAVVTLYPSPSGRGVRGEGGRHYRLPTERDYRAVWKAQQQLKAILDEWEQGGRQGLCPVPDEPTPAGGGSGAGRAFSVQRYGMLQWGDLFTARQKVAMFTFAKKVLGANYGIKECHDLLAIAVGRAADATASLTRWLTTHEEVKNVFSRQALPIVWDFGETNPTSQASRSWSSALEAIDKVLKALMSGNMPVGQIQQADSCQSPLPDAAGAVWFTDPPYYDAIPYSDLSDYFLVWLKRTLPGLSFLRDPFDPSNALSPKSREVVQDETKYFEGKPKDRDFFEGRMAKAFSEGRRVLRDDGIGSVVFAHKTTEGWEALLTGIIRGAWTITASWPIATEAGNRLRARDSAALATSVHLVCRPRPDDAPVGDWAVILRELPKRVGDWMERLQGEGIRGADLVFACIGPALEIFSRYARVETAEGREVTLAEYLEKVWEVVGRTALEQVLGTAEAQARNSAAGALEEDARLTALFLWTLQSTNGKGPHPAPLPKGEGEEVRGTLPEGEGEEVRGTLPEGEGEEVRGTLPEGEGEEVRGTLPEGEPSPPFPLPEGEPSPPTPLPEGEGSKEYEGEGEEGEVAPQGKAKGYSLVFDVVRRFAQPLGIALPKWEGRIIETKKGVVRLLAVTERARQLFGQDGAEAVADWITREPGKDVQRWLFPEMAGGRPPKTAGRKGGKIGPGLTAEAFIQAGATTLDRVHAAMLLQAGGQAHALRALIKAEMERGPDFLRLANALSALYPTGSEEKRLLDAMLLAVPR